MQPFLAAFLLDGNVFGVYITTFVCQFNAGSREIART